MRIEIGIFVGQMYSQMTSFEDAMDEINVQQKVMSGVMNKNEISSDMAVDNINQNWGNIC